MVEVARRSDVDGPWRFARVFVEAVSEDSLISWPFSAKGERV